MLARKRRRLRLPVSHRRTSLPRIRRASRTPTPASTPSLSIDEGTPRCTTTPSATPVRRSRRLARPSDFRQDSDTSVVNKPSPSKSDDSNINPKSTKRHQIDKQRFSPSKESDTSPKSSSDRPIRNVNNKKKNTQRLESDTSEVDKRTSPSKAESDTSRKDSTSDSRTENIIKRLTERQNTITDLERQTSPLKDYGISRKEISNIKYANLTRAEKHGSDSSELVEKVTNYESDVSLNSNRTTDNINVTKRGQSRYADASQLYATLNEDADELRDDSILTTALICTNVTIRGKKRHAEKNANDVVPLKKISLSSDDSQNNSASNAFDKHGNVTIRGQKNYADRPYALNKQCSLSSDESPNVSGIEEICRSTDKEKNGYIQEDDELVKKLSSLFNEESDASDTIARNLNITARVTESTLEIDANHEQGLTVDKVITNRDANDFVGNEDSSASTFMSEVDNIPASLERGTEKLDENLVFVARRRGVVEYKRNSNTTDTTRTNDLMLSPDQSVQESVISDLDNILQTSLHRSTKKLDENLVFVTRRRGVVEYKRNSNTIDTTRTNDLMLSPDQSVRESDQTLGSLAPTRPRRGVAEYRRKTNSSMNTTIIDNSLESSKSSDDYEQGIGNLAPVKPRHGVAEYRRNANATITNHSLWEQQNVTKAASRRAGVASLSTANARANVDHELIEYEEALRPRRTRAVVSYKQGDTPGVPGIPKPKRMRIDSDTDSQDENSGGGMISVRADVHRASSPQRSTGSSNGSRSMSLTPPASIPRQTH